MSSHRSSNEEEQLDSRYSTPAPELDDHRGRASAPARVTLAVPELEVQTATPNPSEIEERDYLSVEKGNLKAPDVEKSPIARDFENAIDDDQRSDGASFRNTPAHHRRMTSNREGRPRVPRRDRSRESDSSRSTSPANSVEAFAEPRRRQRANTAESYSSSILEFRNRTQSGGTTQRRPTLSNISAPAGTPLQRVPDRDTAPDFSLDDEPGSTYKIDFEELEEFVALSAQGKIPDDLIPQASADNRSFRDLRKLHTIDEPPNVILNADTFLEKPLTRFDTSPPLSQSSDEATKYDPVKPADRFVLFSSELPQVQTASKLGDFVADGTTFRDLFEVGPDGGVWWLDVSNPSKAELTALCKAFKIHRLTQEDIETQEAREKVELFSQYYFVSFRSFNMDKSDEDFLDAVHVYIVVCADGVLSFSYQSNPHARNVRKRISKLGDFLSLGSDYICYAMIDDIVDSFAPIIRNAEQESENIEDQVFIAREDDFIALLRQIGECRKRVLNMMRLLGGKADVIKGFAKRCNEQYEIAPRADIGLYLGDIQDHVVTMMSNLGHVEKMLSRSHANYLAQLNVNSIMKGNSSNKSLTKITVVATILVPLNLVTGLFGMNVHVPGEGGETLYWFFGIIGGIFIFVTTCLCVARRLRAI